MANGNKKYSFRLHPIDDEDFKTELDDYMARGGTALGFVRKLYEKTNFTISTEGSAVVPIGPRSPTNHNSNETEAEPEDDMANIDFDFQ